MGTTQDTGQLLGRGAHAAGASADGFRVAEPCGAAVDAVLAPAGAVRCGGQLYRFGVEHLFGRLDQNQIGDGEGEQRGVKLPRQRGETQLRGQRRDGDRNADGDNQ